MRMNRSIRLERLDSSSTLNSQPANRCRVRMVAGSAQHISREIACLLRRRLRIAVLIALGGFLFFLIRSLVRKPDILADMSFLPYQIGVVALLAGSSLLLWSCRPLSMTVLRLLEVTVFGAMALFFAYLQWVTLNHGAVLTGTETERHGEIVGFATSSNAPRWFMLIVLYGTFIPNTWRRFALVVGCLALMPVVITFLTCFGCPFMGPFMGLSLLDLIVILGMASAVAIFGSYKISELHQEAFEARKLGQNLLHRRLGQGGMGEVYLGEHVLLRRACAIKVIHPDQAGDPTSLERFEREVQAMATLTHWNTVEIYDYGHAEDGTFYYVMEYLPGLSVQELVERHGPALPERAIHLIRQVCGALREAHGIGLIHRDIKPSNIIICQRGGVHDVAKLLDFGLVQSAGLGGDAERLTLQGTILGSPPYMSPEQAAGKPLDARSDLYSLGCVAYFLLTGRPPFPRETAMQMLMAHAYDPVVPPSSVRPGVPADVEGVVLRCLAKDPAARCAGADGLEKALASCATAEVWTEEQAKAWWGGQAAHAEEPVATPAAETKVGMAQT